MEPPILAAEARLGHGIALGGGAGEAVWRRSPVTLTALAEYAIRSDPWTTLYGGLVVEGNRRATAGATVGLRVRPGRRGMRAASGAVVVIAPVTAYGPSAAVGHCWGHGVRLCGDVEGVLFLFGADVPDQRIAAQMQLVVGVLFDAW